jgi:hypothetical protein
VEEVSLMDNSVLENTFTQSSAASVGQINDLMRRLQRRAFLILDSYHIRSRAQMRARLPATIRRLRRQIQKSEKKLQDLETHRPLDEEWQELMNAHRDALDLRSHDA